MTILHVTDFHFDKRLAQQFFAADVCSITDRTGATAGMRYSFSTLAESTESAFPIHIVVRTDPMSRQFFSVPGADTHDSKFIPSTIEVGNDIATIAVA